MGNRRIWQVNKPGEIPLKKQPVLITCHFLSHKSGQSH